jgi:hypothetical protein
MEKFLNIMIAASAGYYVQKALATKYDLVNIGTAILVTAVINDTLNNQK